MSTRVIQRTPNLGVKMRMRPATQSLAQQAAPPAEEGCDLSTVSVVIIAVAGGSMVGHSMPLEPLDEVAAIWYGPSNVHMLLATGEMGCDPPLGMSVANVTFDGPDNITFTPDPVLAGCRIPVIAFSMLDLPPMDFTTSFDVLCNDVVVGRKSVVVSLAG